MGRIVVLYPPSGMQTTQMTGGVNAKRERRSATVRLLFRNCSGVVWV